jgi:N4-gp56 family major capsid protein
MLTHAGPVQVLDKLGMRKELPKNKSTVMKFRRPKVFTAKTTPLVEGVTPTADAFQFEDVTVTLKQYGQVIEITDVIEDTHEDPVLREVSTQAGENIGRTMESLTYGILRAGTNVFYANGTLRTDVNTPVSLSKLRAVKRALEAQKAMKITQVGDSSPKFATRAIEAAFVAVCHTDLDADIRNLPGFLPTAQYASGVTISPYEIGSVEQMRFICSPDLTAFTDAGGAFAGSGTSMVTTTGTSADVYPILVFGKEAYGVVALKGMGAVKPSIIPVGTISKSDPLGQKGIVGWKGWHASVILNQLWMARLEVAVTAL